jgi:hypothetical protein
MSVFNFFIEKTKNDANEITINLDYPIECNDKERLSVKLVDFKYLNSAYNISEALHNNIFSVSSFIPEYNTNSLVDVGTNYGSLAHNIGTSTFLNIAIRGSSLETMEESLVGTDYSVFYGTPNIILGYTPEGQAIFVNKIQRTNFRSGFNNNYLQFEESSAGAIYYIKIHKNTTTNWVDAFILQKVSISMSFTTAQGFNFDVSIIFSVEGSIDNISYTNLSLSDNVMTFLANTTSKNIILSVLGNVPYKYYKVRILSRSYPYGDNVIRLDKMQFYKAETIATTTFQSLTTTYVSVADGFYNIDNLITMINANSTATNSKIEFAKQNYTNKIIISNSLPIQTFTNPIPYNNDAGTITEIRTLIFPNLTTANMYGYFERLVPLNNAPVVSDTYVNIMNFSKIIISTNLTFTNNTHNEISNDGSIYTKGIGNVIEWIDSDLPPMTCITYRNIEGIVNKLDNRFISQFKLIFCTEKSLPFILDNYLIHLQLIKYKK